MNKSAIPALTVFLVLTAVTVYFDFNASALDKRASQSLDSIAGQVSLFADYSIHLSGYTDNTGSDTYNDQLSYRRVSAVKNHLIEKGIDSAKIKLGSYGERNPAVPNTSDSNRARNRRVEVSISGQNKTMAPHQAIVSGRLDNDSINIPKQGNAALSIGHL